MSPAYGGERIWTLEVRKIIRLDKALAHSGWGSRSEMRAAVKGGRVSVDGKTLTNPEAHVEPGTQRILLDGNDIDWREFYYLIMNKPAGYVSSTCDPRDMTVLELLPERFRRMGLFPVGRLDKDSTGLLLLTNNGELAHMLLSPAKHVPKTYEVTVDGELDEKMPEHFKRGLRLPDGKVCLPAELELITKKRARITLYEGKFHQIKRMMSVFMLNVCSLHRISMGGVELPIRLEPQGFEPIDEGALLGMLDVQFAQRPK